MKTILFAALITLALPRNGVAPVLAAPPLDNQGKAHPEFDRLAFVHYADNLAKKGGVGNNAPQLFSYSGCHWASGNVPDWMNPNSSRIAEADAVNGIRGSFQTWQDDPGSRVVFAYQGSTSAFAPGLNAASPDHQDVVGWAYLSDSYPGAIAVTIVWATRGKLIVDSDTALNTDGCFTWTQSNITSDPDTTLLPSTSAYDVDVQNLTTHEAGHWPQLYELYSSAAIEQTISYGYASDRELKKRSLESGDSAGVQKVYR